MHPDGVHRREAVGVGAAHHLVARGLQLALHPARDAVGHVDGVAGGREARRAHRLHHGHVEVERVQQHLQHAHGDLGRPRRADDQVRPVAPRTRWTGTTELKRALPGARLPARPGRGSKTPMQPLYMKPSPSVITPEGMPSEWVMVTQLPSASTTETCVVSLAGGAPVEARHVGLLPGADLLGHLGRVGLSGEPVHRHLHEARDRPRGGPCRSSRASSPRRPRRTYSAVLWSSEASSKCSRMFSISSSITPPPGGWLLETR